MMVNGVWYENITCLRCKRRHPAELSCAEAKAIAAKNKPEEVPCKWCGEPTEKTSTQMCDGCWELDHRIAHEMELAERILNHYKEQRNDKSGG